MLYLLTSIILLGIFAYTASYIHSKKQKRQLERGEITELPSIAQVQSMECCGQHETCEKDSLLAAVSKEIEYYNDEELDSYRGRTSSQYTEEECDEFREVLYTMKEEEVAGWVRSLQLRAVELPDNIKDEVFLIIGERRQQ